MVEHFFQCPFCWEEVSVLIDTSISRQSYVEDCEICCNPMEFQIVCEPGQVISFEANELGQ
ncbi:CPXCG motif-containing cysteine-rich protein [Robiginitalea sp. IMCC43444]|uniref:CPXCG motif-containing cysteine-rich protein n=1 Tax=Robiginitalea sp. IMCC43444 TaxID=3459121 RepID=UPI0040422D08